ncbi:MerR family transcriptional regulator [Botryobacter ruber]|uniref:MerR family transcriptional regulator n=1 Tax=Botryobacter ruber TaxID=2171629 RepID=UPI000E0AB5A9|nr:MerR family transcriptional regulator [Botryobacter ruber]
MGQYSIKELEHLSGIKAHTIRAWEQRYKLLNPKRTETNIRFYDDADLKVLLNVSLLNEKGFKISRIAQMNPEQLNQAVQQVCEKAYEFAHHINGLVAAMVDMDEARFDKTISTVTLQLGFKQTMQHVIYPFLNKIGILWQTNNISPAHEHFISNLIRQKVLVAIDGQVVKRNEDTPTYILFLPEGEMHEIALLYLNYIIRSHDYLTLYLGQNLPYEDLELSYKHFKADYLCTILTSVPERDQVQHYLNKLSSSFPESTILVYGLQVQHDFLQFPSNVKRFHCIHDFVAQLA